MRALFVVRNIANAEPHGLMILGALLKRAGHQVRLVGARARGCPIGLRRALIGRGIGLTLVAVALAGCGGSTTPSRRSVPRTPRQTLRQFHETWSLELKAVQRQGRQHWQLMVRRPVPGSSEAAVSPFDSLRAKPEFVGQWSDPSYSDWDSACLTLHADGRAEYRATTGAGDPERGPTSWALFGTWKRFSKRTATIRWQQTNVPGPVNRSK